MKENNILLAKFLGWFILECYTTPIKEHSKKLELDSEFPELPYYGHIKFHSDWNWLMLVVDKIESLETSNGSTFTIDFHRDSVLIFEYGKYTNEIIHIEGLGRMQNLYNACIEFVKWYNK